MTDFVSPNRRHTRKIFFKYLSADGAIATIQNQKWRFSAPPALNDPLDVPRKARVTFTSQELKDALKDDFLRLLHGEIGSKHAVLKLLTGLLRADPREDVRSALIAEMRRSIEEMQPAPDTVMEQFLAAWSEMVPELRVFCVSECNDSLVMWAHYAEQHQGAVFEIAAIDALDSILLLAQPVTYSDARPELPPKEVWARALITDEPINWSEWFREYYYVKTTSWQYEREWRVISYQKNGGGQSFTDYGFHRLELTKVYLGMNMARDKQAAILSALDAGGYTHVEVFRAGLDQEQRRVVFTKLDRGD